MTHPGMGTRRTLVVHTGGIGDLLLACPALARLAQEAPIELLGRPDRLELAVAGGIAAAAHDIESAGFETLLTTPHPRLRTLLQRFDRAVVWMRDGDGAIRRGIEACGIADAQAFPGLPPSTWMEHASAYYARQLGYGPQPPLRLALPGAGVPPDYDAVVHPGSGGARKNWPLERFLEVALALRRTGLRVAVSTGPAEYGWPLPAALPVLRERRLLDLAARLARARAYLGNDSGVTHLAAAVGCRTVAVFGPTDPAIWAPYGPHVRVVQRAPWPATAEVMDAITAALEGSQMAPAEP